MSTSLARVVTTHEQVYARTQTVRAALQLLIEREVDINLTDSVLALLGHVIREQRLDQTNPEHAAQAEGHIMMMLNLGLERAVGVDVHKAATAIERNPLERIYLIGVRTVDELKTEAQAVLKKDVLRAEYQEAGAHGRRHPRFYGVLPWSERVYIERIADGKFIDADGAQLPPATIAQIEDARKRFSDALEAVDMAQRFDWTRILYRDSVALFARDHFLRPTKHTCEGRDGVWQPLVLSMMINALTEGWNRIMRDRGSHIASMRLQSEVFVDLETLAEFLEIIMFSPEELEERRLRAVTRIASILFDKHFGGYMTKPFKEEGEVYRFLELGSRYLQAFTERARDFYLHHTASIDPSPQELDQFWRTHIFLVPGESVGSLTDRIQAERVARERPWEEMSTSMFIDDMLARLRTYHAWPDEHRLAFLSSPVFAQWLQLHIPRAQRSRRLHEAFMAVAQRDPVEIERLVSQFPDTLYATFMYHVALSHDCNSMELARTLYGRRPWSLKRIQRVQQARGPRDATHRAMLVASASELSSREIQTYLGYGRPQCVQDLEDVFMGLSTVQQVDQAIHFSGELAQFLLRSMRWWDLAALKEFWTAFFERHSDQCDIRHWVNRQVFDSPISLGALWWHDHPDKSIAVYDMIVQQFPTLRHRGWEDAKTRYRARRP